MEVKGSVPVEEPLEDGMPPNPIDDDFDGDDGLGGRRKGYSHCGSPLGGRKGCPPHY